MILVNTCQYFWILNNTSGYFWILFNTSQYLSMPTNTYQCLLMLDSACWNLPLLVGDLSLLKFSIILIHTLDPDYILVQNSGKGKLINMQWYFLILCRYFLCSLILSNTLKYCRILFKILYIHYIISQLELLLRKCFRLSVYFYGRWLHAFMLLLECILARVHTYCFVSGGDDVMLTLRYWHLSCSIVHLGDLF